jgi:DNA repair protein RadC
MTKLSVDVDTWPGESLIAALLASGPHDARRAAAATEVAGALLRDLGGFAGLSRATVEEIEAQLSSGPPSRRTPRDCALRVASAFELGRRAATDSIAPPMIANSADVAAWASSRLSGIDHEELWILAVDGRSRLRAVRCVAKGGLHGLGVRAADPIRFALRAAASGFVLVHNHPSGDPTPSAEDIEFTHRVAAAAAIVGTPLLDHVVVARGGFASVPFTVEGPAVTSGAVDA